MPLGKIYKTKSTKIAGIVSCLPEREVKNDFFLGRFSEQEISQISNSTGVKKRYIAKENTTTVDLCFEAAQYLLKKLNWDPQEIDGLIFITQTPSQIIPASAFEIQSKLNLRNDTFALDINLGCSAYPYGLWLSSSLINNGAKKILLLAGDTINKIINPNERSTAMLFGDAGTATALESKDSDDWHFLFGSDGSKREAIVAKKESFLKMDGAKVFEFTLGTIPNLINELDEVVNKKHDYYLLHQANEFMLKHIRRKAKLEKILLPINIQNYGNTSSASIPLLICTELKNIIQESKLNLALHGFGVGLSWCAGSIFFGPNKNIYIINKG